MRQEHIALPVPAPGQQLSVPVLRFGQPGARPKAYVQAALHADEVPAILAAHALARELAQLEAEACLVGEVVLVPQANPIGATQVVNGQLQGRFDLAHGGNFNRHFAELAEPAAQRLLGRLGDDADTNARLVREALHAAAQEITAQTPADALKRLLLQLAVDADVVLDLHCDTEAAMHVYGLSPQAEQVAELGALLGARAVLLATESGDNPFDEACSRPWLLLQQRLAPHPVPLGCFATTVELRGEADTQHALAAADGRALVAFLARRGVLKGVDATLPAPLCQPTPLSGSEPIAAPHEGVVVFRREIGERVEAGDVIADVVDARTGEATPVACRAGGLLYARAARRWAWAGMRLAKVAGTSLARTGKLLSP